MSTNANLVSPNKVVQRFEACVCCSKPIDVYGDPHARTLREDGVDAQGRHWFTADYWCLDCYRPLGDAPTETKP